MLRVPRTGALRPDRERCRAGDRLPEQAEEACLKAPPEQAEEACLQAYVRACRAKAAERLVLATLGRCCGPAD